MDWRPLGLKTFHYYYEPVSVLSLLVSVFSAAQSTGIIWGYLPSYTDVGELRLMVQACGQVHIRKRALLEGTNVATQYSDGPSSLRNRAVLL